MLCNVVIPSLLSCHTLNHKTEQYTFSEKKYTYKEINTKTPFKNQKGTIIYKTVPTHWTIVDE